MNINQILTATVSEQLAKSVSRNLDLPENKSKKVMDLAIPLLVRGLAKNSTDPQEAKNILQALKKDHSGEILNNISSALGETSTLEDGGKILDHILGNKQKNASQAIGNKVNIDPAKVVQILSFLAPVIMGALGKQQKKGLLYKSNITDFLLSTSGQKNKSSKSDLLSQILDQDKDGSIIDDVANIGSKMLGNLLKK